MMRRGVAALRLRVYAAKLLRPRPRKSALRAASVRGMPLLGPGVAWRYGRGSVRRPTPFRLPFGAAPTFCGRPASPAALRATTSARLQKEGLPSLTPTWLRPPTFATPYASSRRAPITSIPRPTAARSPLSTIMPPPGCPYRIVSLAAGSSPLLFHVKHLIMNILHNYTQISIFIQAYFYNLNKYTVYIPYIHGPELLDSLISSYPRQRRRTAVKPVSITGKNLPRFPS